MPFLLTVSLIWAFSFGLIETYLTGFNPTLVAFIRLGLSLLVFLPFLKVRAVSPRLGVQLMLCGAVQYGVMYAAYIAAYGYLHAYEVALFTVFTPLLVTLFNDTLERRFHANAWIAALLAVAGTALVVYGGLNSADLWRGLGLVMLANVCFAFGQVWYRRLVETPGTGADLKVFAWLYLGATLLTGLWLLIGEANVVWPAQSLQWVVLGYLGIVASGLGFFLWNVGARRVNGGTLAVFNNLKVPLAVAVALLIFGEQANGWRLLIGGSIVVLALWLAERKPFATLTPAPDPDFGKQ